ncbi:MAG: hypothetical protein Q8L72_06185 [Moraxellaceae bacterium]|nr:hypothetical protein [Moraxellaceae bacterium]
MSKVEIKRLHIATVFSLIAKGLIFGLVPIFTILGLLASVDLVNMSWNSQPVTGAKAIVLGQFMGVFFALFGTVVLGVAISLGLWIYSLFWPLTIQYLEVEKSSDAK